MRILALAYACEPGKGSEPGAGWAWARMLARLGETWVITRENNRPAIEGALSSLPEAANLHFAYVDLRENARSWKRGGRGLRTYYLLWQFQALREARRLQASTAFDLVWHLTFANAYLGSVGPLVGVPFVFGPVGGGVVSPLGLIPVLGTRGLIQDLARRLLRAGGRYANPLARLAWNRAEVILAQNNETLAWLPRRHRGKTRIVQNAVLDRPPVGNGRSFGPEPTALFAGRLLSWKGPSLAIRAVGALPEWRLLVCGNGPDEARLRALAERVAPDRVEFRGLVPRDALLKVMEQEVDVMLLPTLHDDAPLSVVEALGCGIPVVSLDRGGPPLLGAYAVHAGTVRETVTGLVAMLSEMPLAPRQPPTLEARVEELRGLLGFAPSFCKRGA